MDGGVRRAQAGIAAALPRRVAKPAKPVRRAPRGWRCARDGAVLVETRPASGLLGGMLGLPGDDWAERPAAARPPFAADWRELGEVRHTFTHFHLVLRLRGARVPADAAAPFGAYAASGRLDAALPSVMRKALRLGVASLGEPAG